MFNPGDCITLSRPCTLSHTGKSVRYGRGSIVGMVVDIFQGDVVVSWDDATETNFSTLALEDLMLSSDYELSLVAVSLGRKTAGIIRSLEALDRKDAKSRNAATQSLRKGLPSVKAPLTVPQAQSDVEAIRAKLNQLFPATA